MIGRPGCRTGHTFGATRRKQNVLRAHTSFSLFAFWVCLSRSPVDGPHGKNVFVFESDTYRRPM
ncbi:uncharacterized protein EI90DRAFT_2974974 [Cantharellus anzutake]|uniref:uncharacterized protein n=1 Tax=Cantharellus anzutake TaxID=1750568 RepID=UPI0019040ED0|nr:uncharacterized protein EI90DRAFT_2974974 [Cantharellus anzutake]KAF8327562.1 hypothetical protein EI90DRAFT_2974974 [Cantharellus anzutake]